MNLHLRWIVLLVFSELLATSCGAVGDSVRAGTDTLSLNDLDSWLGDGDTVLVDTRQSAAYNGWSLDGNEQGGHLAGAVNFAASWLSVSHDDKEAILSKALKDKGIVPSKRVILYSVDDSDRQRVARYLQGKQFRRVHTFDLNRWTREGRQLVRYPGYEMLLPPSIVKQLLAGKIPESFDTTARLKFVEVSWGDENASYAKGHVPRSFHVNTDHFEPPPAWKLGDAVVLKRFAMKYGFRAEDTVIISGEDPTACYRLRIVLIYMGLRDVRVLDGGFAAWKAAGGRVDTQRHEPTEAGAFDLKIPADQDLVIDISRVRTGLDKVGDFSLIDTRTWAEFIGKTSGYKYHEHKGRIPGAIYGQADFHGSDSLTPYRNIDQTMRNGREILELWGRSGIDTKKHLSFMCGGGWRAAEVLTFARVMGLENTSLYSDGWIGWSNDASNPREIGEPGRSVIEP